LKLKANWKAGTPCKRKVTLGKGLSGANCKARPEGECWTRAVVTDFGLACIVGDNSLSQNLSGGILGTPNYMPPEVWQDQLAGPASDIYALGSYGAKTSSIRMWGRN